MQKIGIVILIHNFFKETIDLVTNIKPKSNEQYQLHIVVVDNNSTDRTNESELIRLLEQDGGHYIANASNSGYAQGNNIGLQYYDNLGYEYCFIVNPDMKFENSEVFFNVLDKVKDKHFALTGVKIGNIKAYQKRPSIYHYLFPFIYPLRHDVKGKNITQVYKVYGCFMLVNIPVFRKTGFFDPATFLYCEEDIIAEKLRRINEPILYIPDITVNHQTSGVVNRCFSYAEKRNIAAQSLFYYLNKIRNYPKWISRLLVKIDILYNYTKKAFKYYEVKF
jgi:GT2 family glycosyltransferase